MPSTCSADVHLESWRGTIFPKKFSGLKLQISHHPIYVWYQPLWLPSAPAICALAAVGGSQNACVVTQNLTQGFSTKTLRWSNSDLNGCTCLLECLRHVCAMCRWSTGWTGAPLECCSLVALSRAAGGSAWPWSSTTSKSSTR